MRFSELPNTNDLSNSFRAEAMLTMSSIIRVGQSQFVKTRIDEDSIDRIMSCFRALAEFKQIKDIEDVLLRLKPTAGRPGASTRFEGFSKMAMVISKPS